VTAPALGVEHVGVVLVEEHVQRDDAPAAPDGVRTSHSAASVHRSAYDSRPGSDALSSSSVNTRCEPRSATPRDTHTAQRHAATRLGPERAVPSPHGQRLRALVGQARRGRAGVAFVRLAGARWRDARRERRASRANTCVYTHPSGAWARRGSPRRVRRGWRPSTRRRSRARGPPIEQSGESVRRQPRGAHRSSGRELLQCAAGADRATDQHLHVPSSVSSPCVPAVAAALTFTALTSAVKSADSSAPARTASGIAPARSCFATAQNTAPFTSAATGVLHTRSGDAAAWAHGSAGVRQATCNVRCRAHTPSASPRA
jgi:hypothetical protein